MGNRPFKMGWRKGHQPAGGVTPKRTGLFPSRARGPLRGPLRGPPNVGDPSLHLDSHTGGSRPLTQTHSPRVHRNTRTATGGQKGKPTQNETEF